MGLGLSFCEFQTVVDAEFIGLDNYVNAFQNEDFITAMTFTIKFTLVSVVIINVLAFLLALMLTRDVKGTNFFRTVFFMPNLIGGLVLGYIWQAIINGVLMSKQQTLLSDSKYGFWGLIVMMCWQMIGYMMVIYIAGIQNVSPDLLEAAAIDGANKRQTLFKIIIPMVMPSITICMFLTLSNSFKLFDQNMALTNGGPSNETRMVALDIFKTFYGRMGWEGVGQAKAVVFFIVVSAIAFAQLYFTRNKEVES
jgi:raffinose/stachyose/melibiose transport system permease protein